MILLSLLSSTLLFAQTFVARVPSDPGNLDWNRGGIAQNVIQQIMEGLTTTDHQARAVPAIAESWKEFKTPSQHKIIFKLRKNAKWNDGKQVCAAEFEQAWKKVLDPSFASPYAHLLFDLENAKDYHSGKIKNPETLGVKAIDCQTLEVKLSHVTNYFIALTSHWVLYPARTDSQKQNPFTNGPYQLAEWKIEQYYLLKENPFYYGKKPAVKEIKFLVVASDATALNLFEKGSIHWTRDLPALDRKRLEKLPEYQTFETFVVYHLGFHGLDLNTRCALAYSLNKEQIPTTLESHDSPAYSFVPKLLNKESKNKKYQQFNITKAKEFFEASDLKKSQHPLEVFYYSKDSHQTLMEWVAAQWKKNLGIDVRLTKLENKVYWGFLAKTPPQVFLSGTTASYAHAYAFLSEFLSESVPNWGHFKSSSYDKNALKSVTEAQDELLAKECAVAPLYFRTTATMVSKKFSGFYMNPLTYVYFKDLAYQK